MYFSINVCLLHSLTLRLLFLFEGIPIGVVVQSYDGKISLGVNADMRVVPDGEKFADWMLSEYERLSKK